MKKRGLLLLCLCVVGMLLAGCGSSKKNGEVETLKIAYQYGVAHCPAIICKEMNFIEESYEEKTGKKVEIEWVQMSNGADINTALAANKLDAGFMGVPVAVSGMMNGINYKIFTNESGVKQSFMTNDEQIQSLGDIVGTSKQIALVNIGSANHIALGMALVAEGLDAHSLDSNIVSLKYPDGVSAIESGSVACHIATEPYLSREEQNKNLHEISAVNQAWSKEDSFNVGVASEILYTSNKELYDALVDGVAKAIEYINEDYESAAEITCKYDGNTKEEDQTGMENSTFTTETKNLFKIATFMAEQKFIDKKPESYEALVYDNVIGD